MGYQEMEGIMRNLLTQEGDERKKNNKTNEV